MGTDDKVGEYTFCSSRGVSVVDYLLLKHEDFNLIHDFCVHDFNEFSDHACLSFNIKTNIGNVKNVRHESNGKQTKTKLVFDTPFFKIDWSAKLIY